MTERKSVSKKAANDKTKPASPAGTGKAGKSADVELGEADLQGVAGGNTIGGAQQWGVGRT